MRYECPNCHAWVKDKFIFGLLHFCPNSPRLQEQHQQAMQTQLDNLNKKQDEFMKGGE